MEISWLERWVYLPVLRNADIPCHIGFIMDGNRRFARSRDLPTLSGHDSGFSKMMQVLNWCLALGVKEVSVYAFSVDNFNRSKEEVDHLMNLAACKLDSLAQDSNGFLVNNGIKVSIWGDLSLAPENVRKASFRLEQKTSSYPTRARLNILFSYSSKMEISKAISLSSNWTEIEEHLYSAESFSPPALIIRTSGETRLSDFMVWQLTCQTLIIFLEKMWPELSLFSLASCILSYHLYRKHKHCKIIRKEEF